MAENETFFVAGVLHLPPLPGAPACEGSFQAVVDHALRDAEALLAGGIRSVVVENFGDAPFFATTVPPHVSAMMSVIGARIRADFESLGINVLRNDGHAALGVAAATQADFVRINVFTGSAWTDQGLIQGQAAELTRYRSLLRQEDTAIMADVRVKHAVPAGTSCIETLAREATGRGGADGLIVTGSGTGEPTAMDDVRRVKDVVREKPVWVGSGATPETISEIRELADGVIVGTVLHRDGDTRAPIDVDRVRSITEAMGT